MATTKALRFFRAAALPSTANSAKAGDIYFIKPSSGDGQIYVCTSLDSSSIPQFVKYADAYTHPNVSRSNTTSTANPAHGEAFTAIDSITTSTQGHVTAVVTKTVTLPAETVLNISQNGSGGYISGVTKGTGSHDITVTHTALPTISVSSGDAETNKYISAITASGHTITVTKASLPSGTGSKSAAAGSYIDGVSLSGHTLSGTTKAFVTDIASNGTSSTAPTTAAVKSYVDNAIASAIHIKGQVSGTSKPLPTSAVVGDAYVVQTAGTYAGQKCEVGDIIICTAASTGSVAPTWTVIQNNLDVATKDKLGTIKIGYTATGQNYPVQLDSSNKAYVNVPWVDTNTHLTNYLQIKGNGTEAVKFTQDVDKTLNFAPGENVTITAASGSITIAAKDTHYTAAHTIKVGDTTVTSFAQSAAKTTTFAAGSSGKLTVSGNTNGTVTYDHKAITAPTPSAGTALAPKYGESFTYVSALTEDGYGHVTGITTQTVTLPAQYSLPTASTTTKGGIKIGASLEMSGEVCNVVWTDFGS